MKVYVAGASAEVERAERVIRALRERGVEVPFDWTGEVRKTRAAGLSDVDLGRERCREFCTADLAGVRRSDVLLLLSPQKPTVMAWVEFGCATNAPGDHLIIACGPTTELHPATTLADFCFATDEEAIEALARMAGA